MSRKVTLAQKKLVAGNQRFKCNNKPGSNLIGLDGYKCLLWMIDGDDKGCFDSSGYDIDHIEEWSVSKNDDTSNLQALCLCCHKIKTKNFLMHKKNDSKIVEKKVENIILSDTKVIDKKNDSKIVEKKIENIILSDTKVTIEKPSKKDKYIAKIDKLSIEDLEWLFLVVIGDKPSININNRNKVTNKLLTKICNGKRDYRLQPRIIAKVSDINEYHIQLHLILNKISKQLLILIQKYLSSYIPPLRANLWSNHLVAALYSQECSEIVEKGVEFYLFY
jgi:hypothetical protein